MMKVIPKALLIYFFLISYNGSAQTAASYAYPAVEYLDTASLVVTYSLRYKADSLRNSERQENFLLFLGTNNSHFLSLNNLLGINRAKNISNASELEALFRGESNVYVPPTQFNLQIYKNYHENSITTINSNLDGAFRYHESLGSMIWTLLEDKDTISGYNVQKAITRFGGRNWEAWFTTDIPIGDGPYSFSGLPGLILQIGDTRNHYVFELVSVNRPSELHPIEFPLRRYFETTKCGFLKSQENIRNDIIRRGQEAGLSNETLQLAARNMRRRNNPLELSCD